MYRLFSHLEQQDNVFKHRPGSWLNSVTLVAGTTIGAGILALPAVTFPAGIIPSSVVLILVWLHMGIGALLMVEVNLSIMQRSGQTKVSLLTMVQATLDPLWCYLACGAYLFFHYALLVAYVSEGGDILTAALEQLPIVPSPALHPILHPTLHLGASPVALSVGFSIGSCLFVMVLGGITYWGRERFVAQVNNGLVAIVLIAFAGLLVLGLSQFQPEQLLVQHWSTVTPAIPVMLVALCYHNVVPIVTTQLEGDRVKICSAILVGAAIPLVLFLIWNTIILAGVSPELAQGAGAEPGIFDPLLLLRRGESGAMLGILVSLFSEVAISTSFIGFTYSLLHVLSDLLPLAETQPWERLVLFALIIGPPFVLANLNPDLFFAALDAAGAFSIAFLVGILPALMAWQQRSVWQWSTWQRSVWQQGSAQELKSQTLDQSSTGHIRLVPGGTPLLLVILGMTVMVMVQHIWEMFWEMFA